MIREIIHRELGSYGEAFDMPGTPRAYSYSRQPGNQKAWRLGEALRAAAKMPTGDYIDTGLNLLKALENAGFGVFEIGTSDLESLT